MDAVAMNSVGGKLHTHMRFLFFISFLVCIASAGPREAAAREVRRRVGVLAAVHGVAPRVSGGERYGRLEQVRNFVAVLS